MFIHMLFVNAVEMTVVQIVDMSFVFHNGVTAVRTMRMRMLIVRFVVAHWGVLLRSSALALAREFGLSARLGCRFQNIDFRSPMLSTAENDCHALLVCGGSKVPATVG
jgi:hypothetical protein